MVLLLQTLEGVAEGVDEVMDGVADVGGDKEVSGRVEDTVEVACGTPKVVTGVPCASCDDARAL